MGLPLAGLHNSLALQVHDSWCCLILKHKNLDHRVVQRNLQYILHADSPYGTLEMQLTRIQKRQMHPLTFDVFLDFYSKAPKKLV